MKNIPDTWVSQKKILILMGLLLLVLPFSAAQANEVVLKRNSYRLVQIMIPGSDFDDDGTRFTRFPGYVIYNEEGRDILHLPACLHAPFVIRMLPGVYRMEARIEGEKISASFEVAPENYFQQFELHSLGEAVQLVDRDGND